MFLSRRELESREADRLAPYAQKCLESRGRLHPETDDDWRTLYQRDRDRILHTRAFRRLEYKTQVFLNGTGDHLRTRLTHTLEVGAISRNLCRFLGLNEDLAEAIALAHDLGHAPFGHNGDEVLHRLMDRHGGFEHNRQGQRIVESLERRVPDRPGLNLTWEVLEGLGRHGTVPGFGPHRARDDFPSFSLEAQIVDLADEIAYYSHDLDDGLSHGLLVPEKLGQELALWHLAEEQARGDHPTARGKQLVRLTVRTLIDHLIRDVIGTAVANLEEVRPESPDAIREIDRRLISYSPPVAGDCGKLRAFLYRNLYHHPVVYVPNQRCTRVLEQLFNLYIREPERMGGDHPPDDEPGIHRAVCDHIAGMTDRYVYGLAQKHGFLSPEQVPGALPD